MQSRYTSIMRNMPGNLYQLINYMRSGQKPGGQTDKYLPGTEKLLSIIELKTQIMYSVLCMTSNNNAFKKEETNRLVSIYKEGIKRRPLIFLQFTSICWNLYQRNDWKDKDKYKAFHIVYDSDELKEAVERSSSLWHSCMLSGDSQQLKYIIKFYDTYTKQIPDYLIDDICNKQATKVLISILKLPNINPYQMNKIADTLDKIRARKILKIIEMK